MTVMVSRLPATRPTDFNSGYPIPNSIEELLADIQALAPEIRLRADEIEIDRRVPSDLIDRLRTIGIFRMTAARSRGGLEFDLASIVEAISALGRIDGSVGWTAMIGCSSSLFLPLLPQETYDLIYRDSPDVVVAGSSQALGTAQTVDGGWLVTGRWPFASGCQHAQWMLGVFVDDDDAMRGFIMPARTWHIEDTWSVAGLKGTGSHHIRVDGVFVPAANVFDPAMGIVCMSEPLLQAPRHLLPLIYAAVVVGMAEGAVDDIVAMANSGRRLQYARDALRDMETFHAELGRIAAELRAARAMLQAQTAIHWQHALTGTLHTDARLAEATQTAVWLQSTCVEIVDACFRLGGASALYDTSPLQRRLRDIHAAGQHASAQPRHYAGAGKLLIEGHRAV